MPADPGVRTVIIVGDGVLSRRQLGPTAWVVLEVLVLHADGAGWTAASAVSARTIAAELGVSVDTATRALGRLQAAGIIHMERRRDGGRFAGTRWLFDLSRVPGLAISADPDGYLPCTVASDTENPIPTGDTDLGIVETAIVDVDQLRVARRRVRAAAVTAGLDQSPLFEA